MRRWLWCLPMLLVGCVSAHDLGNGRYEVPRTAEVRSPFGTNITFGKLENCQKVFSTNTITDEWTDCRTVVDWHMVSSQGQGGQIAAGALQAAGLGILGAVMPSNAVSATQSQSVTVHGIRGHH